MEASHLLLELLDAGIHLQVVDGQLRAEFPQTTRTPARTQAIRSERDRLIDLASRSPAEILSTLREAGLIISLAGDRVRVNGRQAALNAEHRALIRFHQPEIVNALRREQSEGPMRLDRLTAMVDQLLEFRSEELDGYRRELEHGPEDDPATPEEWAALGHAQRMQTDCSG